ncbi:MAG: hypothetical protein JRN20_13025 [Nitrososphaerota archaeon]|nr:hypothetical protein [Nitrososphaerota archaeon]
MKLWSLVGETELLSGRSAMTSFSVIGLASELFEGVNGPIFMFSGFTNNINSSWDSDSC